MKLLLTRFFRPVTAVALLALALLPPTRAQAQGRNLYDWTWVTRLGSTALPGPGSPMFPPSINQPESLAADAAGNVVIAGVYDPDIIFDNAGGPRYQTTTGPSGSIESSYVAKYSGSGTLVWSLNLTSNGDVRVRDIALDATGNVFVLGVYFQQLRLNATVVALTSTGSPSFLAKFSPAGVLLWVNTIEPDAPGGNRMNLQRVAVDALGNCVVQGDFATRIVFSGTAYDGGSSSRSHAFAARYNASGAFLGAFAGYATAGSALDYAFTGVGLTSAGEVYLSGWISPAATIQFGTLPALVGPATTTASGFVVKLSATNTAAWLLRTTGPAGQGPATASGQRIDGIAVGPQGRCYAVGGLTGSSVAIGAQSLNTGNPAGASGQDIFLARIAPDGAVELLVGGGGTSKVTDLALGPQGQATLATEGGLDWGNVRLPGAAWPNSTTAGLVQFDAAGVPQRGWQAGGRFFTAALAVDGQNQPVLAGTYTGTSPFTFGTRQLTAPYTWNTLIARTGTTLLANRPAAQVAGLEVYPNPARQLVDVRTAQPGPVRVQLLDALGRTVRAQQLSTGQTRVDLAGLAAGSYTLLVRQGDARSYRRLLVQP